MWKREKGQGVTMIHREKDLTSHCWGLQAWDYWQPLGPGKGKEEDARNLLIFVH